MLGLHIICFSVLQAGDDFRRALLIFQNDGFGALHAFIIGILDLIAGDISLFRKIFAH